MMTYALVILFGAAVAVAITWSRKRNRLALLLVVGTLGVGVVAWTIAGRGGLAGSPVQRAEPEGFGAALVDPRQGMTERFGPAAQWLRMSDGFLRMGRTEMAARTLAEGLRRYPRSVDLWVGYGNALFEHAGRAMTPAAALAFDRAAELDPNHPAPSFFRGLAHVQEGDFAAAIAVWQALLDRSEPNAPYRTDLQNRLALLRAELSAPTSPSNVGGQ
jgi:cytochrome c-type biogenesis protein CcmH